jgi:hypothetical protein
MGGSGQAAGAAGGAVVGCRDDAGGVAGGGCGAQAARLVAALSSATGSGAWCAAGLLGPAAALGEGAARRQRGRSGGAPPMVARREPGVGAAVARLPSSASV